MKADPKADAAAATGSSKKKMLAIIVVGVAAVSLGGGAAWYFTQSKAPSAEQKEVKPATPPVYVAIEPFTVNLQPEDGNEPYLQLQFTLQVSDEKQVEIIKTNMARVRSRVLLLLSAKKASELTSVEGKSKLSTELIAALKQPFAEKGPPQEVSDVLYTSFIIQ